MESMIENPQIVVDRVTAIATAAVAFAGSVVTICSAIAALTPTPKDDAAIAPLYRWVERLALNIGKAKQSGEDIHAGPPNPRPPPRPRIVNDRE